MKTTVIRELATDPLGFVGVGSAEKGKQCPFSAMGLVYHLACYYTRLPELSLIPLGHGPVLAPHSLVLVKTSVCRLFWLLLWLWKWT